MNMKYLLKSKKYQRIVSDFTNNLKKNFNDFVIKIKNENNETKAAFDLILKASRGELKDENGKKRDLSENEIKQIVEQTGDVFKLLGITSLAILPGGIIVFTLIKIFKLNDHILPSSFKKIKNENGEKEN